MANGIVSWFDARRGRGVIVDDETGAEVVVDAAEIDGGGRQSLTEGDRVVFTVSAHDVSAGPARAIANTVWVP